MILAASVPWIVLFLSIFCTVLGVGLLVMPWVWRWDLPERLAISSFSLVLIVLCVTTALDVLHHLGAFS